MATTSALQLLGYGLKSVQRGATAVSGTGPQYFPINPVNVERTQVRLLGTRRTDGGQYYISQNTALANSPLYLSSATSIAFTKDSGVASAIFSWEVAEYY